MPVRQISEADKQVVKDNQRDSNGILHCFISGEVISDTDEIEYDHVTAYSYDGPSDIVNVKVVLKEYNRRKKDQTLFDVRDQMAISKLYESRLNNVKLQDILKYKGLSNKNVSVVINGDKVVVGDGEDDNTYDLLYDNILGTNYFYAQLPVKWVQNDDQEGLQPRVIDQKRLFELSTHLKRHPQLAPAIARVIKNKVLLFDGQHKTAAQILNGAKKIDCKVFISPDDQADSRKLFDQLMVTNLDAHSKLRQVPFYSSTLIERFSVIYKESWEDFTTEEPQENHSEANFSSYLVKKAKFDRRQANEIMRAMIIDANLSSSALSQYIAKASKDNNYPTSVEVMKSYIMPNCIYLDPSKSLFDSPSDYRNQERQNFSSFSRILSERSMLSKWVPYKRGVQPTQEQLKAKRIWHKGAVMTWGPMLKDVIINACNIMTEEDRGKLLYRSLLTQDQLERIEACLERLFNHTLWVDPNQEIDKLLGAAAKQDDLFNRNALTASYVLTGNPDR